MEEGGGGWGPEPPEVRSEWEPNEQDVLSASTSVSEPVLCSESEKQTHRVRYSNPTTQEKQKMPISQNFREWCKDIL